MKHARTRSFVAAGRAHLFPARLIIIVAVFAASCATPPKPGPTGSVAIVVAPASKQTTANASVGNLVAITLPSTARPGYEWQIALHDTRFLRLAPELQPAEANAARPSFSFVAQTPGRARLRFVLLPANPGYATDSIDVRDIVLVIE